MGITSKITVGLMAAACICAVNAEEVASIKVPADLNQPKRIAVEGDTMSFKGNGLLLSVKSLALDPAKKYKISGEFRAKEGTPPVRVYLGLAPYDAKKKPILPRYINTVVKSATEVAADAQKGSTVITVKDASAWNNKTPYGYITLNAQDDFSDLPNVNQIPMVKGSIKANGDVWEIGLKAPLKADISAGTKVRQQLDSGTYIYCTGSAFTKDDQWMTRSGIITGIAKNVRADKKLWPGTTTVKIIILFNGGKPDSVTEFKDIKIEEVK